MLKFKIILVLFAILNFVMQNMYLLISELRMVIVKIDACYRQL
ncbi:hypothetical protein EV200_10665 [Pedobacter psychrotolerans]|uniref:Uncharacterized protein n=1 Tax=Pedobacter psychrotolerans TaxID=1843235 RepID=A0A4R2H7K8_9SPHI|nr:hypothetical protein EV200_10665 [Pedobacter psychrotolerans]